MIVDVASISSEPDTPVSCSLTDVHPVRTPTTVDLDLPEIAALMASLAALGPTVSDSAASVMRTLVHAAEPAARRLLESDQP